MAPENHVRCDRVARRAWATVPENERAELEARIPDDQIVTLLARTGVGDLTARRFRRPATGLREHELLALHRGFDAGNAVRAVLRGVDEARS